MRRAGKIEPPASSSSSSSEDSSSGSSVQQQLALAQTGRRAYWLPPRRDVLFSADDVEEEREREMEMLRMHRAWEDEVFGRRVRVVEGRGAVVVGLCGRGGSSSGGSSRAERRVPRRWRGVSF